MEMWFDEYKVRFVGQGAGARFVGDADVFAYLGLCKFWLSAGPI